MEQYSSRDDLLTACRHFFPPDTRRNNAFNQPMNGRFSIALSEISSIADVERQWHQFDRAGGGSFFTSWTWIGTWLGLLPSSVKPHLLRFELNGRSCGAAIAVRRNVRRFGIAKTRYLHLNETGDPRLDCLTIEHNGFAGLAPNDPVAWQTLLDWFGSGAADADELSISGVTYNISAACRGRSLLPSGREIAAYRVDLAALRAIGGGVGSILSANSRQQLNRSIRVLAALGPVRLVAAKTVEEALTFFDALKRLHIRSWTRRGQHHGFVYPFAEQFHRSLITQGVPRKEVELLRLSVGTRELGYLYNFSRGGIVYAYQSGFADEDRRLRPGYVAHALAIERSAASGATSYDFMAGTNRLKQSFATEHYAMRWYRLQSPLLRFRAEQLARAAKRHFVPLRTS